MSALLQLFQRREEQRGAERTNARNNAASREDGREAAAREERLEACLVEWEARLDAVCSSPCLPPQPRTGMQLRFPTFPRWSELHAAMLHAYSQSYGAAGAYQDLHSLRRLAGSTGKEAYARVEEHSMLLRSKRVHNPGPEEQTAYVLQNQLTTGESARWISLANADEKSPDAALHALVLGDADARTGRLSCPPPTREAFFSARREHLRNFLNEQGPAPAGDRSLGASAARAVVSTGHDAAGPLTPPSGGGQHPHRHPPWTGRAPPGPTRGTRA